MCAMSLADWKRTEQIFGNRSSYSMQQIDMVEDAAKRAYKLARSEMFRNHLMVSDSQEKHDHHIINGLLSLLLLGYEEDFHSLAIEIFDQGRIDARYKPVGLATDMMLRILGQTKATCG